MVVPVGGLKGEFPRKSDGRRVFTVEFKRGVVQQRLKGEKTLAEGSRELDIQPSVVRQWKRRFEAGATAAVATNEGQEADGDRDPAGGAGGRKKGTSYTALAYLSAVDRDDHLRA